MAATNEEVAGLLTRLNDRGVQVWQNRGKLYSGPRGRLSAAEEEWLRLHRSEVALHLRFGPRPRFPGGRVVAPMPPDDGSYAGRLPRKPWDYEVAIILPTLGSPDLLRAAVRCWRAQTVSPYLLVIDTGSRPADCDTVMALRDTDLECHFIRCHGWRHSSSPVAAANDLGAALAQTPYLLFTHVDVFPRWFDLLQRLIDQCGPGRPVIGYDLSPRASGLEKLHSPSHSLTLCHGPTYRAARLSWNLLASLEKRGEVDEVHFGWPDTETRFADSLSAEMLTWHSLGREPNRRPYQTDEVVHWRSLPSARHYAPGRTGTDEGEVSRWLARTYELGVAAPLPESERDAPAAHGRGGATPAAEEQEQGQGKREERDRHGE